MDKLWNIIYNIFRDFRTVVLCIGVLFVLLSIAEFKELPPYFSLKEGTPFSAGRIISLLFGVTLTGFSVWFFFKGRDRKLELLATEESEQVLLQLAELSSHPITIVFAKKIGQQITDAFIKAASPKANQFYGYPAGTKNLIGKGLQDLLTRLKQWMDRDDFDRFEADQVQISQQVASGEVAYAKIPMRLNDEHPEPELRGKVFWPITVGRSREFIANQGERQEYLTIMYLDIDLLPRECRELLS